jgi:ElaB/YqjD/DUF883 family membrane-anchored ribosome-binding protein
MADERFGAVRPGGGEDTIRDRAAGAMQDAYGKTVDAAAEGAQAVKKAAVASHDFLRDFMEANPHVTTALALGIGLLVGYAAAKRPAPRVWWE